MSANTRLNDTFRCYSTLNMKNRDEKQENHCRWLRNPKFEARNPKQYRNYPPHADPLKAENVQNSKQGLFLSFL